MLSTNFDWKSESLKVWKSESLKSEMLSDSKNFFFLVFLGPSRAQIRKKNKSENFEKFGHFLLPVLRNKAQGLTPSGKFIYETMLTQLPKKNVLKIKKKFRKKINFSSSSMRMNDWFQGYTEKNFLPRESSTFSAKVSLSVLACQFLFTILCLWLATFCMIEIMMMV